jgi:hypothetical protein
MLDIARKVHAFTAAGRVAGQALDNLVVAALICAELTDLRNAGLPDFGRPKEFAESFPGGSDTEAKEQRCRE